MLNLSSHQLQKRVMQIHDHLYANGETRTSVGIAAELSKVLHVGSYLEEVCGKRPAFSFDRATLKSMEIGESAKCKLVVQEIREAFYAMKERWHLYDSKTVIQLQDDTLAYTVSQLEGIYISDPGRDVLGDALEIVRTTAAKRLGGQFFTDQRVTSLAMTLLQFDPRQGDDLIDVCAGTGGFLLAGINRIRHLLEVEGASKEVEITAAELARSAIRGIEVDSEVASIANGTLESRIGGSGDALVHVGDSLSRNLVSETSKHVRLNSHLCTASNPPFGTTITVKNVNILRHFELSLGGWP